VTLASVFSHEEGVLLSSSFEFRTLVPVTSNADLPRGVPVRRSALRDPLSPSSRRSHAALVPQPAHYRCPDSVHRFSSHPQRPAPVLVLCASSSLRFTMTRDEAEAAATAESSENEDVPGLVDESGAGAGGGDAAADDTGMCVTGCCGCLLIPHFPGSGFGVGVRRELVTVLSLGASPVLDV